MSKSKLEEAKKEIDKSLYICTFCIRNIGITFDKPKSRSSAIAHKLMFSLCFGTIIYHVFSEIIFMGLTVVNTPSVEDIAPLFVGFGYGILSIAKVSALWWKKDVFTLLLEELREMWPTPPLSDDAQELKKGSLASLRAVHRGHFWVNIFGVWFYNLTPLVMYVYRVLWQGQEYTIGYIWSSWYPFDKHQTVLHFFVYIFEIFAGQTCVWIMVGTDLLFSSMSSYLALLMRMLHLRLEALGTTDQSQDQNYKDIVENIKLHQRLIKYSSDLEQAFTVTNFVNIIFSSVTICCVLFVIVLLEPLMVMSGKLLLVSIVIQAGLLCGYADDVFTASSDVATAAYNSEWYRMDTRCRRLILFLMKRAQDASAYSAMSFVDITLVTYSAILTRSYSYFTLLYTMYKE